MPFLQILIFTVIFLASSIISVISGSTSLITIPAMLAFRIEPHIAIATNMLGGLTFNFNEHWWKV